MALLSQAIAQASCINSFHHNNGGLADAFSSSSQKHTSRVSLKTVSVHGGSATGQNKPAGICWRAPQAGQGLLHSQRWRHWTRRLIVPSATEDGDEPLTDGEMDPPSDVNVEPLVEAGGEEVAVTTGVKMAGSSYGGVDPEVSELKQQLIDSLYGTERGLRASGETRGEVVELISQLEARNPTPAPTEALDLLDGKWVLAYTSFSELYPLLATGNLPLVKVGEISQTIDTVTARVENRVTFSTPLATTSFGASASFEVRSAKRVQVKFEETVIDPPQLPDVPEMPSEIEVFGQRLALADLGPLQGALLPLQEAATSALRTLSEQAPVKIPIPGNKSAESWLLTTYLDDELRISRGDGNSVFILVKEGSPLLD